MVPGTTLLRTTAIATLCCNNTISPWDRTQHWCGTAAGVDCTPSQGQVARHIEQSACIAMGHMRWKRLHCLCLIIVYKQSCLKHLTPWWKWTNSIDASHTLSQPLVLYVISMTPFPLGLAQFGCLSRQELKVRHMFILITTIRYHSACWQAWTGEVYHAVL